MTNEQQQLLIKDLSVRLSYGVKCFIKDDYAAVRDGVLYEIDMSDFSCGFEDTGIGHGYWYTNVVNVKPYLRPMTTMTDVERDELHKYTCVVWNDKTDSHSEYERKTYSESLKSDWLNEHMFDYRGLIGTGLALVAPDGMYDTKGESGSHKYFPSEFGSYEEYAEYLKKNGYALDAPDGMYNTKNE